MKPEGGSKMDQVQGSRRRHRRQHMGLAQIQCQISQEEKVDILFETFHGVLVLPGLETVVSSQSHKISPGFQHEEDA